ncbi:hypothetical protein A5758_19900 [Mycobacterium sp. 852014-50255_SCH5639931]|nr:hypothetical protein A5758_19900 [Mycobacterium sp. 852014-50255_SCH5639931]
MIAAIITVVVLIAAALTALFVFPPKHSTPPSPEVNVPTPKATPGSMGRRAPTAPTLVSTAAISLDDVSITPAPGWVLVDQEGKRGVILGKDKKKFMEVIVVQSDANDVAQVLPGWIRKSKSKLSLTSVEVETASKPEQLNSPHFQQKQSVRFSGDLSTQQGTLTVYGVLVVLLNPSTGEEALIDLFTPGTDLRDAAWPDAENMISSML